MKFIPVRWIPDPKVIEFLNDIEKVDIPENKRGILEMISCAFKSLRATASVCYLVDILRWGK